MCVCFKEKKSLIPETVSQASRRFTKGWKEKKSHFIVAAILTQLKKTEEKNTYLQMAPFIVKIQYKICQN